MGPKPGQKLTDKPKDYMLRVRLDAETVDMLDECANALKLDRSKVVRLGIQKVKDALGKSK